MPALMLEKPTVSSTEGESKSRRQVAIDRFNRQFGRTDGGEIVSRLADGLTFLRDLFFQRIHDDVEAEYGMDSMLNVAKTERITRFEIEIYQAAESAYEMVHRGYVKGDCDEVANWLLELRLGPMQAVESVRHRLARYLARDRENRERFFSSVLITDFPGSARAPLVLFHLYPLAVDMVSALAFRNVSMVREFRRRQLALLPAIADCRRCRGQSLDIGERCNECGNPLWKFRWLTAE